jgi:hypothetical protein
MQAYRGTKAARDRYSHRQIIRDVAGYAFLIFAFLFHCGLHSNHVHLRSFMGKLTRVQGYPRYD